MKNVAKFALVGLGVYVAYKVFIDKGGKQKKCSTCGAKNGSKSGGMQTTKLGNGEDAIKADSIPTKSDWQQ